MEDLAADDFLGSELQSGGPELVAQAAGSRRVPEVREQEVAGGTKDPPHLREEALHGAVAVRGLDIHDGIETRVAERERLRIALNEGAPRREAKGTGGFRLGG